MSKNQKKTAAIKVAATPQKGSKKLLIILISAFVGVVLVFGAIFGIIAAVTNAGYVALYGNLGIDDGVCRYLASCYKSYYLKNLASIGIEAYDTEEFWSSKATPDNTYGELLTAGVKNYVAQIIAANIIFDEYTSLSEAEKYEIESATKDILNFRAEADTAVFNRNTSIYGFDFSDFKRATELLYKAWAVSDKVMGEKGENAVRFGDECVKFFSEYSNVHLIFVRTETTFVLDENGNRVVGDDGNDMLRELTQVEKIEREERLADIRATIEGISLGEIVEERFFHVQDLYDEGDRTSHEYGYYFHRNSAYANEFSGAFEAVVNEAYEMEVGEIFEVETTIGPCFIYKTEVNTDNVNLHEKLHGLSDFLSLAGDAVFQSLVDALVDEITFREAFDSIDFIKLPYNTEYIARY